MKRIIFLLLFFFALLISVGLVSASYSYNYDRDYRDYRYDYDDYNHGGKRYYTTTYMSQSAPTVDKWYTYHQTGYNKYPPNLVTIVRNGRVRYSYYYESFSAPYGPPYHYYGQDYRGYDYRYYDYNRYKNY